MATHLFAKYSVCRIEYVKGDSNVTSWGIHTIEGFHSVIKRHHNCYKFVVRHVGVLPVLWRLKSCRASRRILAASLDEVHPKVY